MTGESNAVNRDPAGGAFRLDEKVALITGAGGGLGSAIALAYATAGASIVALEHDAEMLAGIEGKVRDAGGRVLPIQADVSDPKLVADAFDKAEAELGPVDVLVNSAFVFKLVNPEELTLEDWRLNLDVNLTGYLLTSLELGRRLIARESGGAIVNISSIAGSNVVGRRSFVYGIVKAAVNSMTKELAVEWAKHDIRVNAIQPAQVMTPGLRKRMDEHPFDADVMERLLGGIPFNRMGEPDEIADPALFLASDAARYVTGVLLPVDGGNLAMNAGGSHTYS